MTILEEYRARHPKSAALWERARTAIPGGITHDIRHLAPFPVYVERARGTRKWDADGPEDNDDWVGHGRAFPGPRPTPGHPALRRAEAARPPGRDARPGADLPAERRQGRRGPARARRRRRGDSRARGRPGPHGAPDPRVTARAAAAL